MFPIDSIQWVLGAIFSIVVLLFIVYMLFILLNRRQIEVGTQVTKWNALLGRKRFSVTFTTASVGLVPYLHRYEIKPLESVKNDVTLFDLDTLDRDGEERCTFDVAFKWGVVDLEKLGKSIGDKEHLELVELITQHIAVGMSQVIGITTRELIDEDISPVIGEARMLIDPELETMGVVLEDMRVGNLHWEGE